MAGSRTMSGPHSAEREVRIHPLWLLCGGYWLWLIWACAGEWTSSQDYNYGWFVPPLALYFLWKRMSGSPATVPPVAGHAFARGLAWFVIVVAVAVVFPLEVVRQTPIHWRPNLWAVGLLAASSTLAVAWLTGGGARLGIFLVPSLFMLVGIPWPTFVENAVSFPLMQLVAKWSVAFVHLLGYPATAAGTTINLSNCAVGVEEACSGLRSLQTALMVGIAAGELVRLRLAGRIALLALAFLLAIAANQVRVLILVLAGINGGSAAVQEWHDAAGYVVLAILLGGVGLAAALAKRLAASALPAIGGDVAGPAADASGSPHPVLAAWVALALGCVAMLGAHGWYWWRASLASPPSPPMLEPSNQGGFIIDRNVPAAILGVLQPDEYAYIRESAGGTPTRAVGYHFYWNPREGNANQLYHRPDHCMPGAGWRIDGAVTRETVRIGGRDFVFNVFPFRGPSGPALMLWGSFLNGEPVEIKFTDDVYLNTANLAQFIRTGTRVYSYEVAACIMPYPAGQRPTDAEVEAYANRIFSTRETR